MPSTPVVNVALQLLTRAFEALKAFLEVAGSRDAESDHTDARKHRPKHLKEKQWDPRCVLTLGPRKQKALPSCS